MARRNPTHLSYQAIRIEGGLIPADELSRLTLLSDPDRTEQSESHYHIPKGLKLRDEVGRYWKIALNLWLEFQRLRARTDVDAHDVTVREFLVPLLHDVLGFADLGRAPAIEQAGHRYPIGHAALGGRVPLVFAAHQQPLDLPVERFGDPNPDTGKIRRRSPFMLAQEALNASDASLWAIAANGLRLRILRDNPSLTRPAYVEVDLEALFGEELYADFTAFWLLAHASRFGAAKGEKPGEPGDCPWERWRAAGQEAGVTIRRNLRYQVAEALRALGTGFLSHPANAALRTSLQTPLQAAGGLTEGCLGKQAFFEELLRLVYRLIFLATVEDRLDPETGAKLVFLPGTPEDIRQRYLAGYSLTWLRERAARRSQHDRHGDLWQALGITFSALARGEAALGLPALGGLFDADQCPHLDGAQLENRWLLAAVFQLGYFRDAAGLTRVNYRDMGPEELGSVYESLLELEPDPQGLAHPAHARLAFVGEDERGSDSASTRGNTRKLTGSYYTPDSLVQELIRCALEPVIADTVKAHPQQPVQALLQLTICDPACGSGHFLLAAARRLADEVARLRAVVEREGGAPTPADYRHALRDVVSRCLFGIDKNPMAIHLAKTALWLEAYTPDLPLSFIDHHLQVGDALLGVLDPKVLENGIPDAAYTALSGDDKATASALKKENKADLKSWQTIAAGDLFAQAGLAAQAVTVDRLADDTPEHIAAKRAAWQQAQGTVQRTVLARLADTYVAAFLAPKLAGTGETVPLSGYLWGVLHGEMSGQEPRGEVADMEMATHALCRRHSVFHWWLSFPQVAARGGFSVMLGNPPWERIKLQEEEFFAAKSPLVASARNKFERGQRIEWLRDGVLLHNLNPDLEAAEGLSPPNRAEIALYDAFIAARRGAEAASLFAHCGERFPLTGVGDVNTYALFAETFLQATTGNGRAGFIVPTGIATDDSTKAYFGHIATGGRLASLYDFENSEGVFPAVHRSYKFSLLTLGTAPEAVFVCFATQVGQLADPRRRFTLTPDEFSLINPNTRTCPVFRSERDADLTKKLYRAAPVLIEEAVTDADGQVLKPEVNPWGIRFQAMFHMSNDSGLFHSEPESPGAPQRLPLYEAKMIHQFDHRWATYVDADGKPGEVETADVNPVQKADPAFAVRPRYWVDEREVLARIARVPARVARAWLALHAAASALSTLTADEALADLLLALAAWVAGELFSRAASDGWTQQSALPHIAPTEAQLKARYAPLAQALLGSGLSTRKALVEFPKWAAQNRDARLSHAELAELATTLQTTDLTPALLALLDAWMDARSPRWLMGWRDICRSTDERTVIASVVPRVGVGNKIPLFFPGASVTPKLAAALLANMSAMTLDFVARQKIGGTTLNYFYMKQFPVLSSERYTPQDLAFIVPRVLELTYTAHDLSAWAEDLVEYDPRNGSERGQPFPWRDGKSAERRARLRAELDACYARLYGLTRDELRYLLDPADIVGADYPSETFRVLKEGEIRTHGEYRTRRLVLAAWDRQTQLQGAQRC
ncbi:MAG TPA: restriction endonuclease [Candidatus Accumulibacter sp.]|nr:restriction endonuclease [Accumulibacter sp.]